jgi:hypothetical protein
VRWQLVPAEGRQGDPFGVNAIEVHSLDGRPVGQRLLSQLGLGRVHDALTLGLADPAAAELLGERWGAVVAPKPGRRGRPDLFYARVALDYVRALGVAPATPTRRMLDDAAARGEHMTVNEVRARLRRARRRGLLTDAPPGRPGGELTDRALTLLREVGLLGEGE